MFNLQNYFSSNSFFNKVSTSMKGLFHKPSLFSSFDYLIKKVNFIPYLMLALLAKVNANEVVCGTYTNSRGRDDNNNDYCMNYNDEDINNTIEDLLLYCNSTLQETTQTFAKMLSFFCFDNNPINMTFNQLDHRFLNCLCSMYDCFCFPPEDESDTNPRTFNNKIMLYIIGTSIFLTCCVMSCRLYHNRNRDQEDALTPVPHIHYDHFSSSM